MKKEFENILKDDKIYFSKYLYLILTGGIFGAVSYMGFYADQISIVGYVLSGFLILLGFISINDFIKIELVGKELIVVKRILGKSITKQYDISKIDKLRYNKKVKSNFYSSSGEIKMMGVDMTPESMKKYYYHNEIISFECGKHKIEIGKWKKSFNGKKLYDILRVKNS